jgi:hypothetical protein
MAYTSLFCQHYDRDHFFDTDSDDDLPSHKPNGKNFFGSDSDDDISDSTELPPISTQTVTSDMCSIACVVDQKYGLGQRNIDSYGFGYFQTGLITGDITEYISDCVNDNKVSLCYTLNYHPWTQQLETIITVPFKCTEDQKVLIEKMLSAVEEYADEVAYGNQQLAMPLSSIRLQTIQLLQEKDIEITFNRREYAKNK